VKEKRRYGAVRRQQRGQCSDSGKNNGDVGGCFGAVLE